MPSSLPVADIENSRLKLLLVFAVFLLPFQINGFYNPLIQDNAALFWLLDIGSFIILPAGLLWLATKRKWLPQGSLCLHFPEKNNARIWFIIYTVLLCPALYLLYYYSYLFAGELFPVNYGAMPFSYQSVIPQTKFLAILTGIHFSLTAGIVEEIYYRGVFRQFFSEGKYQAVLYIAVSAIVFSSPHWEGGLHNLFASFIIGLATATSFWFYRYLIPLIIAHCFVDSMFYLF